MSRATVERLHWLSFLKWKDREDLFPEAHTTVISLTCLGFEMQADGVVTHSGTKGPNTLTKASIFAPWCFRNLALLSLPLFLTDAQSVNPGKNFASTSVCY